MKLTREQFEILTKVEGNSLNIKNDIKTYDDETIKVISKLLKLNLIDSNFKITKEGIMALEPYRVKRAIFLAAGFGSRMMPLTINTPKPLINVNGKKMIETLLDAAVDAQIPEIVIVRGYLGETFDVLLKKYPNIKFVDNFNYEHENNISSAYLVRDLIGNSYVCESDLILSNSSLIRKYEYNSNFLGIKVDKTDDWILETDNGIITGSKIGGTNCHLMIGISYFTKEDGLQVSKDIEEIYNLPEGKNKFWDQVILNEKNENYKIGVRECKREDIVEIDTVKELKKIDKRYKV